MYGSLVDDKLLMANFGYFAIICFGKSLSDLMVESLQFLTIGKDSNLLEELGNCRMGIKVPDTFQLGPESGSWPWHGEPIRLEYGMEDYENTRGMNEGWMPYQKFAVTTFAALTVGLTSKWNVAYCQVETIITKTSGSCERLTCKIKTLVFRILNDCGWNDSHWLES